MNNILCGSWEESAKIHVQEIWKYKEISPPVESVNDAIRVHLDYMIDEYFNAKATPLKAVADYAVGYFG